ncbi:MAG: MFS transporter [Limosilactobacillus sp.]|nr:MFS transporter [Limosilactobacillus sp.]
MQNKQIRQALIIMVFGTFLGVLCSTVMNIAIPPMMKIFKISEALAQWVINGYSLVNALMIPVSAYLIKRYSFRNLFITFSGVFLFGTIIGASAHFFPTVVIARML